MRIRHPMAPRLAPNRRELTDDFVFAKLSVMEFVAVSEAARQLGVTTRQVQHLVARGDLHPVARGLIDQTSLDRHLATRQWSRRRAWSEATAWGAVAILSGRDAHWMGQTQRSRLKGYLRRLTATEVAGRARSRARVHRYDGHSAAADRLRHDIIDTSEMASALGLAGTHRVDGYVATEDLNGIVARHALTDTPDGAYTLRATAMELGIVGDLAHEGHLLAAFDLAESLDVPERQTGLTALDAALRQHRG